MLIHNDVWHNLLFNYCNLLFLVFLCKKRYFRLENVNECRITLVKNQIKESFYGKRKKSN